MHLHYLKVLIGSGNVSGVLTHCNFRKEIEVSGVLTGASDQSHVGRGNIGASEAAAGSGDSVEKPACEQAPAESSLEAAEAVPEAKSRGAGSGEGVIDKDFAALTAAGPAEMEHVKVSLQAWTCLLC